MPTRIIIENNRRIVSTSIHPMISSCVGLSFSAARNAIDKVLAIIAAKVR